MTLELEGKELYFTVIVGDVTNNLLLLLYCCFTSTVNI